jgi:uncharacterized protein YukE
LQGWNPESLAPAATSITAAGESIYNAVRDLDDGIDRMPESQGWSGQAQRAAVGMFRRATEKSSAFKNYAEAVAAALQTGSSRIGTARTELLRAADAIDNGPLNVTDQWVVMIDPAGMSAERASELQKQAEAAQAEINPLASAVKEADAATSRALLAARTTEGLSFNIPVYGPPGTIPPYPVDDVPDPGTPEGKQFQDIALATNMASTVRDISKTEDAHGNHVTTFTMLDGSTQVATEYVDQGLPSQNVYPPGTINVLHTDKSGHFVSQTTTIPREGGGKSTEVWYAGGTHLVLSETADGKRTGSVTTAEGKHGVLPDSFFNDPIPTLAGGALSGLETKANQGIPALTASELEKVKLGAKWGGPALGLATMVYGMVSADTLHDRCVAAWSGGAGLVGGFATSVAVGAVPGVGPIASMGANVAGGFVFGYVGELVGNVMCPP